MKIFNLDLHISVIADVQLLLTELGHEVTSWNMSGHNWVFGRQQVSTDVVSPQNWSNINQEMCDRFYNRYKDELSVYDAFLVTYPPVFAWLFEKWNKPIIIVAPIRYEVPFCTNPDMWNKFNQFLANGIDSGKIIPIANSKFDAAYAGYFTKREWIHIPSMCEYTGSKYTPQRQEFLYYSRMHQYSHYLGGSQIDNLRSKEQVLSPGYKWDHLCQFKGIVGVPYNVSTMSMFEHYTQCVPMFFPSVDLMCQMRKDFESCVLAEMTWNQTWNLTNKSSIVDNTDDPNDFKNPETFRKWVQLADFYDKDWMPNLQYFNTWDELKNRLTTISDKELRDISQRMAADNIQRKRRILDLWKYALTLIGKTKTMSGQGQINRGTTLGESIFQLAQRSDVNTIVEIGTWNGLGTTKCVTDAIQGTNKKFTSLEACEGMYNDAVKNNSPIPDNVKILHARITDESELDTDNLTGDEPKWLDDDRKFYRSCPNIYNDLPKSIDLLILDGGEFSSYAEFQKLWKRARFIVMDDTIVRKFRRVRSEILNSQNFTVMADNQHERNGYMIVENIYAEHLGGAILGGDHGDDGTYAPQVWDEMIKMFHPKTVIDIGCGAGYSLKYFLDHHVDGIGVEGWREAIGRSPVGGNIVHHDYTKGPFLSSQFDIGWSCEFVEHVDEEFASNFMETFKLCKRVVMTHAIPGQPGHHHVNCQPSEYWIQKFKEAGFKYLDAETKHLRSKLDGVPNGSHAKRLMLFERSDLQNSVDINTHKYLYDPKYNDLSLSYAKELPDAKYGAVKWHFYWRVPREFSRKQVLPLLSAIKTQPANARIILWSNVDLSNEPLLKDIKDRIVFKIWDAKKESVGTPLENHPMFNGSTDDELCYLGGDLFRLLCLYKYGGVYVDMDTVVLRDFSPLLHKEFMYQWGSSGSGGSETFKQNGAVMHLFAKSQLATDLLLELSKTPPDPNSTCWGTDLYEKVRLKNTNWTVYPCVWFNSEWCLSIPLEPFKKNVNGNTSAELYDGAFSWHWHNKWSEEIEIGSKFQILEQKFNG